MVWPFKKQKEDLDLTILAKRGLIKPEKEKEIDMTSPVSDNSAFGFLGAMASAESSSSSLSRSSSSSSPNSNKIDDMEFKLDSLSRKLNSMLDRIDLVEKKLERDLRRGV